MSLVGKVVCVCMHVCIFCGRVCVCVFLSRLFTLCMVRLYKCENTLLHKHFCFCTYIACICLLPLHVFIQHICLHVRLSVHARTHGFICMRICLFMYPACLYLWLYACAVQDESIAAMADVCLRGIEGNESQTPPTDPPEGQTRRRFISSEKDLRNIISKDVGENGTIFASS